MCNLCGSSQNTGTNTTTVTNNVPAWINAAGETIFNRGNVLSQQPYQPYGAARIAPFTGDTLASFGMTQQAAPSYQPYMGAAAGAVGTALGGFNPVPYMNPYWQEVAQRAEGEAIRQDDIMRAGRSASAVNAGAFGGSRHALMESEAQRNLQNRLSDIYLRGGAEAYDRGTSAFFQDAGRYMGGARTLADLGQREQQLGLTGAGALGAIGTQQQAQGQRSLDLAYQNFLEQRDYPQTQLSYLANLFKNQQQPSLGQTTSQTTTQPGASLLGQLGSLGLGAYGLYNMFGLGGKKKGGPIRRRYGVGGPIRRYQEGGDIERSQLERDLGFTQLKRELRALGFSGREIEQYIRGMAEGPVDELYLRGETLPIPPMDPNDPRSYSRDYGQYWRDPDLRGMKRGGPVHLYQMGGEVDLSVADLEQAQFRAVRQGRYGEAAQIGMQIDRMRTGETPVGPSATPQPARVAPVTPFGRVPNYGIFTPPSGPPRSIGDLIRDPEARRRQALAAQMSREGATALSGTVIPSFGAVAPSPMGTPYPGSTGDPTELPRPVTSLRRRTGTGGTAGPLPSSVQAATAAPAATTPDQDSSGGTAKAQSTIRDAMTNNIDRGEAILMMAARMGEAASRPGATFIGSLGAGGVAGLENLRGQRRDARDAARYEQDLARRDRDSVERERHAREQEAIAREQIIASERNSERVAGSAGAGTSIQIRAIERASEILANPNATEPQRRQAQLTLDALRPGLAATEQRGETSRETNWLRAFNASLAASRQNGVEADEARRIARADADEAVRNMGVASGRTPSATPQAGPMGIPARPATLPPGSQFSPSRRQWRDPQGRIYDEQGNPVGQ